MLYNPSPKWGKHDGRGWKSINGAINEAKELTTCLLMNARLWGGYSVGVTVNILAVLPEDEVKSLWAFVCRNLKRAGVIAFWRREVTADHRVHYHMLVASRHDEQELDAIIEAAFPAHYRSKSKQAKRRITIAYRYDADKKAARYITKAKVAGYTKAGKWVDDYYRFKRSFFLPAVKLRTVGEIGSFWKEKKEDLWKKVIKHEREVAAKVTPQLEDEAEELYDVFGPTFTVKSLIRHLAEVEIAHDKRVARLKLLQTRSPVGMTPPVIVKVTLPSGITIHAPVIQNTGGVNGILT
jgi:hypothetical protein